MKPVDISHRLRHNGRSRIAAGARRPVANAVPVPPPVRGVRLLSPLRKRRQCAASRCSRTYSKSTVSCSVRCWPRSAWPCCPRPRGGSLPSVAPSASSPFGCPLRPVGRGTPVRAPPSGRSALLNHRVPAIAGRSSATVVPPFAPLRVRLIDWCERRIDSLGMHAAPPKNPALFANTTSVSLAPLRSRSGSFGGGSSLRPRPCSSRSVWFSPQEPGKNQSITLKGRKACIRV